MTLKARTMLTVGVVLFLCCLVWQPAEAMEGARQGLILWYQVVLPSQFPFIAAVNVLLQMQSFSGISPAVFNFFSGMISGYPVGSMTAAKLFHEGKISSVQLTRQAALCNMAGPLFIVGTVGVGLLQNVHYGYMLLLIHWGCAGGMSLFCALRSRHKKEGAAKRQNKAASLLKSKRSVGTVLGDAVGGAAEVMLKVAGFITIFSVILQWTPGWIGGVLEMTNGLRLAAASQMPLKWKLALCSFLINFSGICIILQSLGAAEAPIEVDCYVLIKVLQGSISMVVTVGICQILGM